MEQIASQKWGAILYNRNRNCFRFFELGIAHIHIKVYNREQKPGRKAGGKNDQNAAGSGRTEGVMLQLQYDKQQIEDVIDKIVKKTMNMDLTWDWPCGVAYYGISDAYEKTGKEEYLNLLKDRVDELIDLGLPRVWTVNA